MCTVTCKVDETVKSQAESIFESIGITMSAAINMFLRASIREGGLPIDTKINKHDKIILERLEESKNLNNLSPTFDSFDDAQEWLNA